MCCFASYLRASHILLLAGVYGRLPAQLFDEHGHAQADVQQEAQRPSALPVVGARPDGFEASAGDGEDAPRDLLVAEVRRDSRREAARQGDLAALPAVERHLL
eukprot:2765944-Pleurochrysis_carterae.AAC.1